MSKYLGDVSAYAYAVSQGYTGTEEEFAELMASYAEVAGQAAESARQAAQSATTAGQAASSASGSASTANTKAEEAASSAQTASTKASEAAESAGSAARSATTAGNASETAATKANEASQSATDAASSATTANTAKNDAVTAKDSAIEAKEASETAQGKAEEAAEEATTTVANKADKDGNYPDLSVGNVFSDDSYTEDQTPYLYRVSGGGVEVGKVEADTIVGGTIAWNQLVKNTTFPAEHNEGGMTIRWKDSQTVHLSGTNSDGSGHWIYVASVNTIPSNNHIYVAITDNMPTANVGIRFGIIEGNGAFVYAGDNLGYYMFRNTRGINSINYRLPNGTYDFDAHLNLFDLTQMFGSAVADMIYAMETANAGSGVAFFRSLFPNDYYAYNAGELMHVSGVSEHVMTGLNWFDEGSAEWIASYYINANGGQGSSTSYRNTSTFTQVLSNTSYAYSVYKTSTVVTSLSVAFYDADKNFISRSTPSAETSQIGVNTVVITTPVNARYARLNAPTDSKDICISLSSSRNGKYEPYVKHSYPLDSSLTLRGLPKLDSSNNLYYDGDVYSADGTVTRKYGIVDLGTLTWTYRSSDGYIYTNGINTLAKGASVGTIIANAVCSKYPTVGRTNQADKTLSINDAGVVGVFDSSYSDAETFKTAMNGVMLVYELKTSTEETAQPFTEYQKVSAYGTEEYVSTGIVPVGHVTKYPTDIVSKVDGLPSDFSTLIAPTEKGFTATRNYTVNQFLIVNNQLYKVTSAIASGATITPNTNVTAVTVADILTQLLNA